MDDSPSVEELTFQHVATPLSDDLHQYRNTLLAVMLVAGLCLAFKLLSPPENRRGKIITDGVDAERESQLREKVKRIRLDQQGEANKKAIAAKKVRKEKEREEKIRKAEAAMHEKLKGGDILGGGTGSNSIGSEAEKERRRNHPNPQRRNVRSRLQSPFGSGNIQTLDNLTQTNGSNWNTRGTQFNSRGN